MARLATVIRMARTRARLSEAMMGRLVGLDEARVQQLEVGEAEPTPEELDAYARAFGLRASDFAEGEAEQAPLMRLFFRSASEGGRAALDELIATDAQVVLGDFLRSARDIAELEAILERRAPPSLPVPPRDALDRDGPPPYNADRLADWLRAELGLGLQPIPSMIELVTDRLGVRVAWVTPEELNPVIEGASTVAPRPAILVNLVEGPFCWWRTRMTLGHELCHLLCDQRPGDERLALFSPHAPREIRPRWELFDGFDRIERRAGAFAACFLAPAEAVKTAVGTRDVTSEEAISIVGQTFGLGRTTAINRLQHVFGLSREVRRSMEARSASHWMYTAHPDRVLGRIGLRDGSLRDLAVEALVRGRIDRVQVRAYLQLPLTEPLPEDPRLTAEQRAPVRRREDKVRAIAQAYVDEHLGSAVECFAAPVEVVEGGWRVTIEGPSADQAGERSVPCGYVIVSYGLAVMDANLSAAPQEPRAH